MSRNHCVNHLGVAARACSLAAVVAGVLLASGCGGDSGPAAAVKIKDGKYDSKIDGKGTVGGAHVVKITGLDGVPQEDFPEGAVLFAEYATTADLPQGDAVEDFDVPATAAAPRAAE